MSFYDAALHHRTGDVIFSRDRDLLSRLIRGGHLLLDWRPGRFSHVTLCAFPGLFIDSVPKDGVRVFDVEHRSNDCVRFHRLLTSRPVVLRPPPDAVSTDKVLDSIAYWTGQEYSFRYVRAAGARRGTAYCSQFVAQVFAHAGVDLGGRLESPFVTPTALYDKMVAAGAADVTEAYIRFDALLNDPQAQPSAFSDDLPRVAVRLRLEQSIRTALTNNISDSTSILTLKQQIATRKTLSADGTRHRTPYKLVYHALEGLGFAYIAFDLLRPRWTMGHWARGLSEAERLDIEESVSDRMADLAIAAKDLRNQIEDLEAQKAAIAKVIGDGSSADRGAVAARSGEILMNFSAGETRKVEDELERAMGQIDFSRRFTTPGADETRMFEAVENVSVLWDSFMRAQLEVSRASADLLGLSTDWSATRSS